MSIYRKILLSAVMLGAMWFGLLIVFDAIGAQLGGARVLSEREIDAALSELQHEGRLVFPDEDSGAWARHRLRFAAFTVGRQVAGSFWARAYIPAAFGILGLVIIWWPSSSKKQCDASSPPTDIQTHPTHSS